MERGVERKDVYALTHLDERPCADLAARNGIGKKLGRRVDVRKALGRDEAERVVRVIGKRLGLGLDDSKEISGVRRGHVIYVIQVILKRLGLTAVRLPPRVSSEPLRGEGHPALGVQVVV